MALVFSLSVWVCGCSSTSKIASSAVAGEETDERPELVVLVHGLGRSPWSMRPLARRLEREGYVILNWGYSSTSREARVEDVGPRLVAAVEEACADTAYSRVNFVGHSLGNLMIRWLLAHGPPANLGRVVMLVPPNRGARFANGFADFLAWVFPALEDLRTDGTSDIQSLQVPEGVEIGIVAARKDFKVRLEETHLAEESDHVVVETGHTRVLRHEPAHDLTVRFLREGCFSLY